MSQPPQCIQCGGTEYVLESGFYFCAECQVQSQEIHEQVFDEYFGSQKATRFSIAPQSERVEEEIQTKRELTSWEVLNYILKGLVDELILLGASKDLKIVVLQLWARYLMKTEAAFISSKVEKRPRLGVAFKTRDAELVYGSHPQFLRACKTPIYRKKRKRNMSSSRDSGGTSTISTARSEKLKLALKKKALAKAEYESRSESSQTSALTLESLGNISKTTKSEGSQRSYKLRFSKHAEIVLKDLIETAKEADVDQRKCLQKTVMIREKTSPRHPHIIKIIAIIRLALLVTSSPIQFSDIFRWNREGYLSVRNAEKFLPSSATVNKDVKALFIKGLSSWEKCQQNTYKIAHLLQCTDIQFDISALCKRFCAELCLPGDVFDLINKLIKLKPPKMEVSARVNYEGRAMAFIIVILKLLFSLDDYTEFKISQIAKKLNSLLGEIKMFDWSNWVEYINCRSAVVSTHCQATRDKYFPDSRVGGSGPFVSQWDYAPARQTISRRDVIDHNLASTIRKTIGHLACSAIEPMPPSLSPLSNITMILLDERKISHSKLILEKDFTKTSLQWLVSSFLTREIMEEHLIDFEIRQGIATEFKIVDEPLGEKEVRRRMGDLKKFISVKIDSSDSLDELEDFIPSPEFVEKEAEFMSNDEDSSLNAADKVNVLDMYDLDNEVEVLNYPQTEYWFHHGVFSTMSLSDFNILARSVFSNSFFWLLNECAKTIDQNIRDLYYQVTLVEKVYFYYLSPQFRPSRRGLPQHFFTKW